MNNKYVLIINEAHDIFKDQMFLLEYSYERLNLSNNGETLEYMKEVIIPDLCARSEEGQIIVFASPVGALMSLCSAKKIPFMSFHNDKRDAKEIPDGKGGKKVIHSVSSTGWVLV